MLAWLGGEFGYERESVVSVDGGGLVVVGGGAGVVDGVGEEGLFRWEGVWAGLEGGMA